jgi:uncharacterized protein
MIRIDAIKLPLDAMESEVRSKAAAIIRVDEEAIISFAIAKKTVDARRKDDIHYVYCVNLAVKNESGIVSRCKNPNVHSIQLKEYTVPHAGKTAGSRPVIVGSGPAGLFCALVLARSGIPCTVLERGEAVEHRQKSVEQFWLTGQLNPASNTQFGEGGAGTFSDGKLTTGTNDERHAFILKEFVAAGAPADILCLSKPHIGTDKLRVIVKSIREQLIALGCDFRFENKLDGLTIENGKLSAVSVSGKDGSYSLKTGCLILAPGHSARDTYEMLYKSGVTLSQKNFAVGVRIEHLQKDIDKSQYKAAAGHANLPASDYKLSCHLDNGRSAFSFCVCPGGYVVGASSDEGMLVTNGMSAYARDAENINGALLVGVTSDDFADSHPLAGMYYQMKLEKAAFELGGSNYYAPAQLVGDFLEKKPSVQLGRVRPSYRPGVTLTDISKCLPAYVTETMRQALLLFNNKVKGYSARDAVMTAVESRSSSPVRIERNENFCSNIEGLYPCGEGAGYAGGIMSAATDGIKCAEAVFRSLTGSDEPFINIL